MNEIQYVSIVERTLVVQFGNGKTLRLEDCWLRDHCRCSQCYNADTFQRALHILDIPDATIAEVAYDKNKVLVTWDDKHKSRYKSDFLSQFHYNEWTDKNKLKHKLWNGVDVAERVPRVHVDTFLSSVKGSNIVFRSLVDYGVVLIEGVEPTCAGTEKVVKALGGVQNTLFGGIWEFTTTSVHADTAYTNLPLAAHNDTTYFTEAAGLQILHCIEHSNGTGGETILVDGFYGAARLKTEHPKDFKFLSTFDVAAEYIEDGHNFKYSAPVINVDKTGDVKQIRFNVYDRSPMAFASSEDCRAYYRSLRSLARYYEDPSNQWRFKLDPGTVMVMDNFRVLHGRTGFSGKRVLCGAYVARSDWLDRARVLQIIR